MSHANEDFTLSQELNALRENLPQVVSEEGAPQSKSVQAIGYSIDLARRIIDYSTEGRSLHWISRQAEMPSYPTLLRWKKDHPEFSRLLRSVRELRAHHFEEAAIDAAESAQGKDADRLKVETYKWAAEVNDPLTYGKKVQTSHEVSGGVTVKVVTGFGDPNPWQTPPKLNQDGTIDKSYPSPLQEEDPAIISVESEVLDARSGTSPDTSSGPSPGDQSGSKNDDGRDQNNDGSRET